MTAHWGVHDPAAVQGSDEDKRGAFLKAYTELYRRISLFINLPFDTLAILLSRKNLTRLAARNDLVPCSCRHDGAIAYLLVSIRE